MSAFPLQRTERRAQSVLLRPQAAMMRGRGAQAFRAARTRRRRARRSRRRSRGTAVGNRSRRFVSDDGVVQIREDARVQFLDVAVECFREIAEGGSGSLGY